jgi:hypothetical protein
MGRGAYRREGPGVAQVEPVALVDNPLHLEPLKAAEAANVVLHPLFLLAPRSLTTRSLKRAADVFT